MGKRVLIVVNAEWYFVSHRLPLARALRAEGYDVVIVAGVERGAEGVITGDGFRFVALDIRRRSRNLLQELRTLVQLYELYRRERPDLVHHITIKPIIYGSLAAKAAGVAAVINAVTGQGAALVQPGPIGAVVRWVLIAGCRLAFLGKWTRAIFQNPEDLESFVRRGIIPAARSVLIRGAGVDIHLFHPAPVPDGAPVVVLASRLLWEKGIREFVEAARQLKSRGVACRFVLVGVPDNENPHAVPTEELERWHTEGIVEWWGLRDDMPKVLQSATIVALPTTYPEGVPKILLEAAACGRPIVASDVPGCREIVADGENGLLVPPRDARALAGAIETLLRQPDLRARMGARGRDIAVDEFSEARTIAATLAVYQELLGEAVAPPIAAAVM